MSKFKEKLEDNIALFVIVTLVTGFTAGIGAYHFVLDTPRFRKTREQATQSSAAVPIGPLVGTVPTVQMLPVPVTNTNARVVTRIDWATYSYVNRSGPPPEIEDLRETHKLQLFGDDDVARPVFAGPVGTYTFVTPSALTKRADDAYAALWRGPARKTYRYRGDILEIHRLTANDAYVLAYVTDGDARRLLALDHRTPVAATLSPLASQEMSVFVAVPINRIWVAATRVGRKTRLTVLDITCL